MGAGQLVEDDGGRSGHPRSADVRGRGRSGREEPDSTVYRWLFLMCWMDNIGSTHRERRGVMRVNTHGERHLDEDPSGNAATVSACHGGERLLARDRVPLLLVEVRTKE